MRGAIHLSGQDIHTTSPPPHRRGGATQLVGGGVNPLSSSNMLPKKISDVLKVVSPRKLAGTSYHSSSRFSVLREHSRSTSRSQRHRSVSQKRPLETEPLTQLSHPQETSSQTPHTAEKLTIELEAEKIENLKVELVKVASICDKIDKDLEGAPFSHEIKEMFGNILTAVRHLGTIQGSLFPNKPVPVQPKPSFSNISYASVASANPHEYQHAKKTRTEQPETNSETHQEKLSENDKKYYKFKETVKDAEKATLIFNLDLGKSPIMNQDTMSTRASLALSKMAAKKENAQTTVPSEAAREVIDDALGMAQGIAFYGKQTKTYRNKNDPVNSGAFCTLPVRYDFKDKNVRSNVEKVLRDTCAINCATPYPLILRECMRQTVEQVKQAYPGAAVRVNVDAHNFCLKVAKKMPNADSYEYLRKHLPLPVEALEVNAKKLPENFHFTVDLTPTPPRLSRRDLAAPIEKPQTEPNSLPQEDGGNKPVQT